MSAEVILEFEGIGSKEYYAVNKELGFDPDSNEGTWPEGLLSHSAGVSSSGRFVVTEVWDSVQSQEKFMNETLGEALAKGGVTGPPASVTWIELIAHRHIGT
jgi:hypothetical protein